MDTDSSDNELEWNLQQQHKLLAQSWGCDTHKTDSILSDLKLEHNRDAPLGKGRENPSTGL